MVKTLCFLDFYPTARSVNYRIPDGNVPKNTIGIILTHPNGTWIKWLVNGKVGWSNFTFLSEVDQ